MTFSDRIPVESSKTGITFGNALNGQRADSPSLAIFLQSLGAGSPSLTKTQHSETVLHWYNKRKHLRNKKYCKTCFLGIASYHLTPGA